MENMTIITIVEEQNGKKVLKWLNCKVIKNMVLK